MTDLLGSEFPDLLVQNSSGDFRLTTDASRELVINRGSVYLWPESLIDMYGSEQLAEDVKYFERKISTFYKSICKADDPISDFFKALMEPDVFLEPMVSMYQFSSRDAVLEALKEKGKLSKMSASLERALIARLQNQLTEYNILELILPNAGARPAIYKIKFPFEPVEPKAPQPVIRPDVDLSTVSPIATLNDEDKETQLLELRRIVTHKGRPYETTDDNGNVITVYRRETYVRDPSGDLQKVQLTAETFSGSSTPVMTKMDDQIFSYVLNWCLLQVKYRKKFNEPLDGPYRLTPEVVMEITESSKRDLDNIREMMMRWKETRLTASSVIDYQEKQFADGLNKNSSDPGNEIVSHILKSAITQFVEPKERYRKLRNGREVLDAIVFHLPPDVQKELERRAMHDRDTEELIAGIPKMMQVKGNRALLKDPFAVAVKNFFDTIASRWNRTTKDWTVELFHGLSEIFDHTWVTPEEFPEDVRRSKVDANRRIFKRRFERFLEAFSDDAERDMDIYLGTNGGVIDLTITIFQVIIKINPRKSKTVPQTGEVTVKRAPLKITKKSTSLKEAKQAPFNLFETLIESGLSKAVSKQAIEKFNEDDLHKIIQYVQTKPNVKSPVPYLATLITTLDPENIDGQLQSSNTLNPVSDASDRGWANSVDVTRRNTYEHE